MSETATDRYFAGPIAVHRPTIIPGPLGLVRHDFGCPSCSSQAVELEHALHSKPDAIFQPCYRCHRQGWRLLRLNWLGRLFQRFLTK